MNGQEIVISIKRLVDASEAAAALSQTSYSGTIESIRFQNNNASPVTDTAEFFENFIANETRS